MYKEVVFVSVFSYIRGTSVGGRRSKRHGSLGLITDRVRGE